MITDIKPLTLNMIDLIINKCVELINCIFALNEICNISCNTNNLDNCLDKILKIYIIIDDHIKNICTRICDNDDNSLIETCESLKSQIGGNYKKSYYKYNKYKTKYLKL